MTSRPAPRGVVFDAVGTLITPDPPAGVAYHRVGCGHGSRYGEAAVISRFGEAFRETLRASGPEPHRTDEAVERRFWNAVVCSVLDDLSPEAAEACYAELFAHFARPEAWRVYSDVGAALRELEAAGVTLAVASNFDARLHGVAAGHPELAPIGRWFVSSEVGWRKPDPRFFAAVCAALRLLPEQVLYVGDDPEADVTAARAAGLSALLLRRGGPAGPDVLADLTQLPARLRPTSGGGAA